MGLVVSLTNPVFANDHNNLDSGRPLSFDDAESLGFGEQSIEFGGSLVFPENSNLGGEFDIEYLNGIIRNGHILIGIDPQVGGRVNSDDTSFDVGNLSVGFFYNFNREYDNVPAFAIRTVQFIRNKALRLWIDAKREDKIDKYSLNKYCARDNYLVEKLDRCCSDTFWG